MNEQMKSEQSGAGTLKKESVPDLTKDPAQTMYDATAKKLREISWSQFEDLVSDLMREAGFLDVQKLTRGSQQGKDVIGTWDSRFCLGSRVKFRFQAKHKENEECLSKVAVGADITDFLTQDEDKVLLIVTNGNLSNDLIDQIDRLLQDGKMVQAIAGDRLVRLLAAYGRTWAQYLGSDNGGREELHHQFDFAGWIENLAMQAGDDRCKIAVCRYWTEPYTWFFYKNGGRELERLWTTVGGDFRFSYFNPTEQSQAVGRIVLSIVKREPLPAQAVINMTPKGWHELKKVEIELSEAVREVVINEDLDMHLNKGGCFSCLLVFKGIDPGIYHFKIRCEGRGGSQAIRESPTYRLVSLGKEYPRKAPTSCIAVHESWPQSMPLIKALLEMPAEQLSGYFANTVSGVRAMYGRNEKALSIQLSGTGADGKLVEFEPIGISVEREEVVKRQLPAFHREYMKGLYKGMEGTEMTEKEEKGKAFILESMGLEEWYEELADPTEPRGVLHRADGLSNQGAPKDHVLSVIEKAHERIPQNAHLCASYGCRSYHLGYLGYATFFLECAYQCAPYDPAITALRLCLREKLGKKEPEKEVYVQAFNGEQDGKDFEKIVAHVRGHGFPRSYGEAAIAPFEGDPDIGARMQHGRW